LWRSTAHAAGINDVPGARDEIAGTPFVHGGMPLAALSMNKGERVRWYLMSSTNDQVLEDRRPPRRRGGDRPSQCGPHPRAIACS
jgi:hypothetical protein